MVGIIWQQQLELTQFVKFGKKSFATFWLNLAAFFCRETNLHDKCCENSRVNCMEKMDNKTIQKLRDLYFKVRTRLYLSNFLRYIHLPRLYVQGAAIITLTKLRVHLGTCWRLFLLELLMIPPVNFMTLRTVPNSPPEAREGCHAFGRFMLQKQELSDSYLSVLSCFRCQNLKRS